MRRAVVLALLLVAAAGSALGAERWGWLGIRIRDLQETEMEDLAVKLGVREGYGVVVAEIMRDTPAAASELRANDLIVSIDGRPVVETRGLQKIVGDATAGRELSLVVLRDGRRREVRVRVGEMPPENVGERVAQEFGFRVQRGLGDDPPSLPGRDGVPGRLVVGDILERSPAARGGLSVRDQILAVNGEAVGSLAAFHRRMREVELRGELRLKVERGGEPRVLVLPPARPAGVAQ